MSFDLTLDKFCPPLHAGAASMHIPPASSNEISSSMIKICPTMHEIHARVQVFRTRAYGQHASMKSAHSTLTDFCWSMHEIHARLHVFRTRAYGPHSPMESAHSTFTDFC
jgi:hypothetical protein